VNSLIFNLLVTIGDSSTGFLSDVAQIMFEVVGLSVTCSFWVLSAPSDYSSTSSKHQAESTLPAFSFHMVLLTATLALHSAW